MNAKKVYGKLLTGLMHIAGKDAARKFDCAVRYRKRINLRDPKTLRDKVIYIENHCPSPLAARCTDKWEVRDYVADKGLGDLLVPVYGRAYPAFDEIEFDKFPDRFVLKATHGCKMNFFCTDKSTLDMERCRKTVTSWLNTTYGGYSGEWHYFDIPHRVYCEHYLDDADRMVDYKFHCMNGVPQFVLAVDGRNTAAGQMNRHIYDMEWNELEGLTEKPPTVIPRPQRLAEMVEVARKLSQDFDFVRVDLYEIEGKVYFGELTCTPTNGIFSHYTDEFLLKMGETLTINNSNIKERGTI